MNKTLFYFLFLLMSFTGYSTSLLAQQPVVYDKYAQGRTLQGSFHSIQVSGSVDVYLTASSVEALAVSNGTNADEIITSVKDSILHVTNSKSNNWRNNKNPAKVYVAYYKLENVNASGASDIYLLDTLRANSFSIFLSNASDFKGTVMVENLDIVLSGASDATLQGVANTVVIKSSGASDVKAYALTASYCTARQSGASDISISVTKEVYLQSSGSSDFHLKGGATITKK